MLTLRLHTRPRKLPTERGVNHIYVEGELRQLAIDTCSEGRQLDRARGFVRRSLAESPEAPALLLVQTSILVLDAKYVGAAEQLLALNRPLPGRPVILRGLFALFEQMRDVGKATAFLRAYQKVVPDDLWATSRAAQFRALGIT